VPRNGLQTLRTNIFTRRRCGVARVVVVIDVDDGQSAAPLPSLRFALQRVELAVAQVRAAMLSFA
jgi:hypothetical protein